MPDQIIEAEVTEPRTTAEHYVMVCRQSGSPLWVFCGNPTQSLETAEAEGSWWRGQKGGYGDFRLLRFELPLVREKEVA